MERQKTLTALLIGAGGYGGKIAGDLLKNADRYGLLLAGVADPAFDALPLKEELLAKGVRPYVSPEEFYRENRADLALVCTPIPLHESHVRLALEKGSHVLCEKPTAATPAQALAMERTAKAAGKSLQIGFQLSFTPGILALKEDVLAGRFGKPLRLSALISWPRDAAYFARSWCGKRIWRGMPCFDSIAMNACAHYLHLMYFILGERMDLARFPEEAEAVLCRTNPVETFDTALFRVRAGGAELRFLATHAGREKIDPVMRFEFEKGTAFVRHSADPDAIRAVFSDGTEKAYGAVIGHVFDKLAYACRVARGEAAPLCTAETAMPHLLTVDAANRLAPVVSLPGERAENGSLQTAFLSDALKSAFETDGAMPWDRDGRFGKPAKIDLAAERRALK